MVKNPKTNSKKFAGVQVSRSGILTVELLVAAITLLSVITFFTTCSFQIRLVWKDIRHQRIAMEELNNQLESITQLNENQASTALANLTPSTLCKNALRNPKLTGSLKRDLLGTRLTLQLNWDKRHPGKPLEVSGWIQNTPPRVNSQSQSSITFPISNQPHQQWSVVPPETPKTASFGKGIR